MKSDLKRVVIIFFALSSASLASCHSKLTLEKISFDAMPASTFSAERATPIVKLFSKKDSLVFFFETNNFDEGNNFHDDMEYFENKFGFELYDVIYFGQILNVAWSVEAFVGLENQGETEIIFSYNKPDSDSYLPAEDYYQQFYLLKKNKNESVNGTVTFKVGNKTIYANDSEA